MSASNLTQILRRILPQILHRIAHQFWPIPNPANGKLLATIGNFLKYLLVFVSLCREFQLVHKMFHFRCPQASGMPCRPGRDTNHRRGPARGESKGIGRE